MSRFCINKLALLLLVLCPNFAWAAPAEVASMRVTTNASAFDSATTLYPNPVSTGQFLTVQGAIWHPASGTYTVTVSGCSTVFTTRMGDALAGSGGYYRSFIATGSAGTPGSCTLTIDPSPADTQAYGSWSADAFTCANCALDVDGGSSLLADPSTSATPSDDLTTLTANTLILGVVVHSGGTDQAITPGGTLTQIGEYEPIAVTPHNAVFRIGAAVTTYTIDWTIANPVSWNAQTAAFKEVTGGGSTPSGGLMLRGVGP